MRGQPEKKASLKPKLPSEIERVRRWLLDNPDESYPTVYRVPPEILSYKQYAYEDAYRPKVVCIGPYFYCCRNDKDLKSMEDYKWKCVQKLACEHNINTTDFRDKCLMKMKELEGRVRKCYSEDICWLNCEELACMLMLDGCFILDLLLDKRGREPDEHDKKVIGRLWIWSLVEYDLLLLENQIPFFVLQKLYEILTTADDDGNYLVKRALKYFSTLDPCRKGSSIESFCPPRPVHHLLHLIYESILPCPHRTNFQKAKTPECSNERDSERDPLLWIPGATELKAAGVKFEKRKLCRGSFLDIKFCNGVMEIPHLEVQDYSDSLFRNLIAFEQCYPFSDFYVTAYAAFMDCLVDTQDDLNLLQSKKILTFRMTGDKDTIHFFSRLGNEVHHSADKDYLHGVFKKVNAYKDEKWHSWRADFRLKYLRSPWAFASMLAAAFALLFTFIQIIFAMLSYFRPPK